MDEFFQDIRTETVFPHCRFQTLVSFSQGFGSFFFSQYELSERKGRGAGATAFASGGPRFGRLVLNSWFCSNIVMRRIIIR